MHHTNALEGLTIVIDLARELGGYSPNSEMPS